MKPTPEQIEPLGWLPTVTVMWLEEYDGPAVGRETVAYINPVRVEMGGVVAIYTAKDLTEARNAALDEAMSCQPSTAENPNEDTYQRGRFDGIMEFARAILALKTKEPT